MSRRPRHPDQPDLLGWEPADPVVAFEPQTVRAASLAASMAKAVSASLKQCGRSREQVAERMSGYLDETVSDHMLNAYASEARGEHIINVVRFIALIEATGDRRLLEFIAELFGWAVIEQRYLPAIKLAQRLEKRAEMDRDIDSDRRLLKRGGVL